MKPKKIGFGDLGGIMYSTDPDFKIDEPINEEEIVEPKHQDLRVQLDKKNRGGKAVTLITGFRGSESQFQELAKKLKSKCGVGGSAKNGEIIVQGDFREKVFLLLQTEGYKVKKSGG